MAKINGLEIKSVKTFKGHEGETCYQGNVYFRGKKLGFWSQSYMNGCDDYTFDVSQEIEYAVKRYVQSDYVEKEYKDIYDLDCLLADLAQLKEDEKEYQKYCRLYDCNTVIFLESYSHRYALKSSVPCTEDNYTKIYPKLEQMIKSYKIIEKKFYNSLEDFNIEV